MHKYFLINKELTTNQSKFLYIIITKRVNCNRQCDGHLSLVHPLLQLLFSWTYLCSKADHI